MCTLLSGITYASGQPATRIWSRTSGKPLLSARRSRHTPTCPVSVSAYWRGAVHTGLTRLHLGADENVNNNIIRSVLRRMPTVDIVRVQDTVLLGADDSTALDWAARDGRESRQQCPAQPQQHNVGHECGDELQRRRLQS